MRLIDADELMMHRFQPPEFSVVPVDICHDNAAVNAYKRGWNDAVEAIVENEPTVEPKRGKWMHDGSRWENRWICSECGYKWFFECIKGMYCPNCGARMEE